MSGISLSPKRALAYPGTRLTFVDESSVAYCFGSAVRITHLLPDKVKQCMGFRLSATSVIGCLVASTTMAAPRTECGEHMKMFYAC